LVGTGLTGQGGLPFVISGLHYGPAQYALPPSALPSLRRLLALLAITYPTATATINGYTDDVPTPGGNLLLSWRRAQTVLAWLVDHGIAGYRLQATGYGPADPVAPNKATGQPLNRRVVVIISPPDE
jgi:outer membrane protein OmpA-like peptidoglycan-associated protein